MNSFLFLSVIYDEQLSFFLFLYFVFMFEEFYVLVIEEFLMRVQICEKVEELKDIVYEKKSILNEK